MCQIVSGENRPDDFLVPPPVVRAPVVVRRSTAARGVQALQAALTRGRVAALCRPGLTPLTPSAMRASHSLGAAYRLASGAEADVPTREDRRGQQTAELEFQLTPILSQLTLGCKVGNVFP